MYQKILRLVQFALKQTSNNYLLRNKNLVKFGRCLLTFRLYWTNTSSKVSTRTQIQHNNCTSTQKTKLTKQNKTNIAKIRKQQYK
jgi:hypothetical protein